MDALLGFCFGLGKAEARPRDFGGGVWVWRVGNEGTQSKADVRSLKGLEE